MKKFAITGLLLFAAAFTLHAQNLPSVRIVNNTGYTLYYIYASPAESDDWGEDFLGDDMLEDGEDIMIRLSQPLNTTNVYDFGVQDEEGDIYFKWDVPIANNARIVFTPNDLYVDED